MATITGYRITKARHLATAFDGEGARRVGGRWNLAGVRAVYLGEGVAIATLEVLVHALRPQLLADAYRLVRVELPRASTLDLPTSALPAGWSDPGSTLVSAPIGTQWLREGASLALRVPSAVVPYEHNLVLNPEHPDFARVKIHPPEPFLFDVRLAAGES